MRIEALHRIEPVQRFNFDNAEHATHHLDISRKSTTSFLQDGTEWRAGVLWILVIHYCLFVQGITMHCLSRANNFSFLSSKAARPH